MNTAPASSPDVPHPFYDDSARLGAEITELCAYIHAATYRLLTLIREFDEKEYWGLPGLCSCAHWLNFQCGIGMIARHGTAHHVEKLVSKYRRCQRLQDPEDADWQHEKRELTCRFDDDGSMIIRGRLPAEQGALIMKALELAMDRADNAADDVTAETLDSVQTAPTPAEPLRHLHDGPHVTAETSRRIACDASIVRLVADEDGEPLSIGRKSRTIPPAIRRALRARDGGCRFPGCTHRSFLDGHHIEHWADGGETSLDNLVQLCRHHHRLVHEGGFRCSRDDKGNLQFRDRRERVLNRYAVPTPVPDDATIEDWMVSHMQDIVIDDTTCIPNWMAGDTMDWDLAVGNLFLA